MQETSLSPETSRPEIRHDVARSAMPVSEDRFRSRVTFTLLAITALGLSFGLVWIGRVIFLLLFAAIVFAIFLTAITAWLHTRLKIRQGAALALFLCVSCAVVALLIWMQ